MAFAVTLSPSPLRVLDRALSALRQNLGWLLLAMLVFFLLPYLAGYFLLYKPLIDGSRDYSAGLSADYLVRYYGFIIWYFVLRGLVLCTAGRLIHDSLRGQDVGIITIVREAPWLWLRSLPIYLLVSGLAYIGQYAWVLPGIVMGLIAAFLLAPFALERQGLIQAWRTGWRLCRGRMLISLVSITLLFGLGYAAQWLIGWANGRFAGVMSFAATSVALNAVFALVQLFQLACILSLYAGCRDLSRPPQDIAQVFE